MKSPDCTPQAIVIRDLVSGHERHIRVDDRAGFSLAGPWWRSDSRTVLLGPASQALNGSTVVAVALDADRATSIRDGVATSFQCISDTTELAFASQVFGSSTLIITAFSDRRIGFPILQCAVDGSPPHELTKSPVFVYGASPDRQRLHLLGITQQSKLVEIGAPPRTLSSGLFQSATW